MVDEALLREHARVVAELRAAGFDLTRLNDWLREPTPVAAKDILVNALRRAATDEMKGFIARVMTQRGFEDVVPTLIGAFESCLDDETRWGIANAIGFLGLPQTVWRDALRLAADAQFGRGRQIIVAKLYRVKAAETIAVLHQLIADRDVDAFAVSALGYCGDERSLALLRDQSTSGRSKLFEREIPKAIARIERRLNKKHPVS